MAKRLTVRGLDVRLARALQAEAKRRGASINRTVLGLLYESTGLTQKPSATPESPTTFTDLDHLAGTWSAEEADAFDRQLRELRPVDAELWR